MSDDSIKEHEPSTATASDVSNGEGAASNALEANVVESNTSSLRKRKLSGSQTHASSKQRRVQPYLSAYNDLYNEVIDDVNAATDNSEAPFRLESSLIGSCFWTVDEKQFFFKALDLKGQHDIRSISRSIGSKSEAEVESLLLALRSENINEHKAGHFGLADYSEIPAAVEVSRECEQALESAADGLAQRQYNIECASEKTRHGDSWLFNADNMSAAEMSTDDQNAGTALDCALQLINLETLIDLSTKFFMNSKYSDGNWRAHANNEPGPGLFCSAFLDLHNLVVGIVRRVVSSAIFLATSRHNLQNVACGKNTQGVIKYRDVQAACNLLGLSMDRRRYWVGLGRRCKLDVYQEPVQSYTLQSAMSYGEVERDLADHEHETDTRSCSTTTIGSEDEEVDLSSIALMHPGQHFADDTEDARAELLDAAADQEESIHLWSILEMDQEPSTIVKAEEGSENTVPQRKRMEASRDWQDMVDYQAQWQSVAGQPSEAAFIMHRPRKPRQAIHGVRLLADDNTEQRSQPRSTSDIEDISSVED